MTMFVNTGTRVERVWLWQSGRFNAAYRVAPTSNAVSSCRNRSERPASTQRAVPHCAPGLSDLPLGYRIYVRCSANHSMMDSGTA